MKEIFPSASYSLLLSDFNKDTSLDNIISIANKYNFFCFGINKDIINLEIIEKILNNNLLITVYSNKNLSVYEAKQLWSEGVKSIFIDDPKEFEIF